MQVEDPLTSEFLSALPIPTPLVFFLQRALLRQIEKETAKFRAPDSQWFDNSSGAIDRAARDFIDNLKNSGQFPASELEYYLGRATDVVADYVVNPVSTIVQFGFPPKSDSALRQDLVVRLSYFELYPTLLDAVRNNESETISRADLESQLQILESGLWNDLSAEGWMNQIKPVCDLLRFASGNGIENNDISVDALCRFTENRGDSKVHASLQNCRQAGKEFVTTAELSALIEAALNPPAPPASDLPASAPPVSESSTASPRISATGDQTQEGPGELPLWKQFSGNRPAVRETAPERTEESPLWKSYAPEAAESPVTSVATSQTAETVAPSFEAVEKSVLGATSYLRNTFVRDLFKGDKDQYRHIVGKLGLSKSWSDSAHILKNDVFLANRIDIYSEVAIAFTNAVEEHIKQFSR